MLSVKTPEEALAILAERFPPRPMEERVPLRSALGRVLCRDMAGNEYVPGFDRSTVDGYAVRAADTFGCSGSIPALLRLVGNVDMGRPAPRVLEPGCCLGIPTGGALPPGGDAAVMVEYTEDYGDGTIAVSRPAAPGENLIRRGDDLRPGQRYLRAGRRLAPQDIGAMAALGVTEAPVCSPPRVGVLSTGDELVPVSRIPGPGEIRDVNTLMLEAVVQEAGGSPFPYPPVPDDEARLGRALDEMLANCDLAVLSGGSSVGRKDAARRVIESRGELLFHGVAMKPGKPTLLGDVGGKAVLGLPGHPAAAFFTAALFLRPLILGLMGAREVPRKLTAILGESLGANHGRAQYTAVSLSPGEGGWRAAPIRAQSGLIIPLAGSVGYLTIPRDCEGLAAGAAVEVTLF